MSSVLDFYEATFKMRYKDAASNRYVDIWSFTSKKSNKRYIVEVEYFSHHFFGIKFYWKGVALSKKRYSLLTNDYEPRTIVMSCVKIMEYYYQLNETASFGFVAAPDINERTISYNKRFRFYRRFMLSIFGPNTFLQAYDEKNSVYLLINKNEWDKGELNLEMLEREISKLYEGQFSFIDQE